MNRWMCCPKNRRMVVQMEASSKVLRENGTCIQNVCPPLFSCDRRFPGPRRTRPQGRMVSSSPSWAEKYHGSAKHSARTATDQKKFWQPLKSSTPDPPLGPFYLVSPRFTDGRTRGWGPFGALGPRNGAFRPLGHCNSGFGADVPKSKVPPRRFWRVPNGLRGRFRPFLGLPTDEGPSRGALASLPGRALAKTVKKAPLRPILHLARIPASVNRPNRFLDAIFGPEK
jgi:hypothetical protein